MHKYIWIWCVCSLSFLYGQYHHRVALFFISNGGDVASVQQEKDFCAVLQDEGQGALFDDCVFFNWHYVKTDRFAMYDVACDLALRMLEYRSVIVCACGLGAHLLFLASHYLQYHQNDCSTWIVASYVLGPDTHYFFALPNMHMIQSLYVLETDYAYGFGIEEKTYMQHHRILHGIVRLYNQRIMYQQLLHADVARWLLYLDTYCVVQRMGNVHMMQAGQYGILSIFHDHVTFYEASSYNMILWNKYMLYQHVLSDLQQALLTK